MKQDKEEIINGMHLAYTELNRITNHVEEAINDKATPQITKQIYWDWLRDRYNDIKPKTFALKEDGAIHSEEEHVKQSHDVEECYELKV